MDRGAAVPASDTSEGTAMKTARSLRWLLVAGLAVGLAGCGQSFEQGMAKICQSPNEATANGEAAPDAPAQATAAALWVSEHVTNAEARQLFSELAPLTPEQKAHKVRAAAAQVGIASCPLAKIWAPRS